MLYVRLRWGCLQRYKRLCEVPEDMIELREIVMARKEPRKLLVQVSPTCIPSCNTCAVQTYLSWRFLLPLNLHARVCPHTHTVHTFHFFCTPRLLTDSLLTP